MIDAAALPIDEATRTWFDARGTGSGRRSRSRAATTTSCCSRCAPGCGGRLRTVRARPDVPADPDRRLHRRARRSCCGGCEAIRRVDAPMPGGLRSLSMIRVTRQRCAAPVARGPPAHRGHSRADRRRLRARRVLWLLAVSGPPHAAGGRSRVLLNLNRVAVLLGVYSNLPWIIVAYYALDHDARRGPSSGPVCRRVSPATRRSLRAVAAPTRVLGASSARCSSRCFWPFMVGSTIGAARAGRDRLSAGARALRSLRDCQLHDAQSLIWNMQI